MYMCVYAYVQIHILLYNYIIKSYIIKKISFHRRKNLIIYLYEQGDRFTVTPSFILGKRSFFTS